MIGALIGDIVGSRFEWRNTKSRDFYFFEKHCFFTDDSVMSLAVCDALLESNKDPETLEQCTIASMQRIGRQYPRCGYGELFFDWIMSENPKPYNSWGNGSAMRVSGCGFAGDSLEEVIQLSRIVSSVSHNHPEGIKGAEATAVALFLARQKTPLHEIKKYIEDTYYVLDFTIDSLRPTYRFDVSCQGSVPQALEAFFESSDFESAIRNAISLGGDSDTLGAICGGVAEAYYGVPRELREQACRFLDDTLLDVLHRFEERYGVFPAEAESSV